MKYTVKSTLFRDRARWLAQVVREEVEAYMVGDRRRECATCGRKFTPRCSWHFFCQHDCRTKWYAGQFRPRRSK